MSEPRPPDDAQSAGGTDSTDATGPDFDGLVAAAREAATHARAPYSGFAVGAAVASDAGVFRGANVENASSPAGVCAERVAAAAAVTAGAVRFDAVAIAAPTGEPVSPCGLCRQFLFELGPSMVVVSEAAGGERRRWRIADLLPDGFGPAALQRR